MNGKPGMEQPEVRNAKQIGIFKKMIITEKKGKFPFLNSLHALDYN